LPLLVGFVLKPTSGFAGPVLLKDIKPGTLSSAPSNLTNVNGTLYFAADDGVHGRQLWKSDGSPTRTILVKELPVDSEGPDWLTAVGNSLFFVADGGGSISNFNIKGRELWKSDGTATGTKLVKDVNGNNVDSFIEDLTNVNGTLFFTAVAPEVGRELWKSDGTTSGTVLVKDINAGSEGSNPQNLTVVGSNLFFSADDGLGGWQLYKSDGSAAGTVLLARVNTDTTAPGNFFSYNNKLFFTLDVDGDYFPELCCSDGTTQGTVWIAKSIQFMTNNAQFTVCNGILYFVGQDGTAGGGGHSLWRTDGTAAGTWRVLHINAATGDDDQIAHLTQMNGRLYFSAYTPAYNSELWISDGTAAGTYLLKNINSSGSSSPADFTQVADQLFFTAYDPDHGRELWQTDGTTAGTVLVADLNPGLADAGIANLVGVKGTLYFTANDGASGFEVWKLPVATGGASLRIFASTFTYTAGSAITLTGQLLDAYGDPVAGAAVEMEDSLLGMSRVLPATDANGFFKICYSGAQTANLRPGLYLLEIVAGQARTLVTLSLKSKTASYVLFPNLPVAPGVYDGPSQLSGLGKVLSFKTANTTPAVLASGAEVSTAGMAMVADMGQWLAGEGKTFITNPANQLALAAEVTCFVPGGQGACMAAGTFLLESAANQMVVDTVHLMIDRSQLSDADKQAAHLLVDSTDLLIAAFQLEPTGGFSSTLDVLALDWDTQNVAVEAIKDSQGHLIGLNCLGVGSANNRSCGVAIRKGSPADVPTQGAYQCLIPPASSQLAPSAIHSLMPAVQDLSSRSGFAAFKLTATRSFSANLTLGLTQYRFGGIFDSGGDYASTVGATGQASLDVRLHLDTSSGLAVITGTVGGRALTACHVAYKPKDTAPEFGSYTMLLVSDTTNASTPAGTGYATLSVAKAGAVRIAGKLADGTGFSASTLLTGDLSAAGNQAAIFIPISYPSPATKAEKGLLAGRISFEQTTETDFAGTLQWIKPQQLKGAMPGAFSTTLGAKGSFYRCPKGGSVLPGFTSGTLELADSSGSVAHLITLTPPPANAFLITSADGLKLGVKSATGLLSGSILLPGQSRVTPFSGVLFQKTKSGSGFFLGPNGPGSVDLK
jgi:ELWxxDGT repeat protein